MNDSKLALDGIDRDENVSAISVTSEAKLQHLNTLNLEKCRRIEQMIMDQISMELESWAVR